MRLWRTGPSAVSQQCEGRRAPPHADVPLMSAGAATCVGAPILPPPVRAEQKTDSLRGVQDAAVRAISPLELLVSLTPHSRFIRNDALNQN